MAYAQIDGVFQNDARTPSCKFTWASLDAALFETLSATPPQIMVQKKESFAATEKAAFSFSLPLEQGTLISGSTGSITMCTLTGLTPEAPAATTTTTTTTTTTPLPQETPAVVVDPVVPVEASSGSTTTAKEEEGPIEEGPMIGGKGVAPEYISPAAAGATPTLLVTLVLGAALVLLMQ